jgi:hypothetical protein
LRADADAAVALFVFFEPGAAAELRVTREYL